MVVINGAAPPNASTAIGNGVLTYDKAANTLCYYFSAIGALAGGEIAAHTHVPAGPGIPAGVILALPLGTPKSGCVVALVAPSSKKDLFKNLKRMTLPSAEVRKMMLDTGMEQGMEASYVRLEGLLD